MPRSWHWGVALGLCVGAGVVLVGSLRHGLSAPLVVLGIVLAVAVIKWLFILAVVAALCWIILFFVRRTV